MWNDTSTTNNDKERWIYECISTPYFDFDVDDSSSPSQSTQSAHQLNSNNYDNDDKFATTSSSSMMTPLEVFTSSSSPQSKQHSKHKHKPIWRLTQKHGGPCGILASIQAELIRILLFGRGGGPTSQKELYYPFTPCSLSNYNANNCVAAPINQLEVKEALGMSIGMILARAALAPRLNTNSNNVRGGLC